MPSNLKVVNYEINLSTWGPGAFDYLGFVSQHTIKAKLQLHNNLVKYTLGRRSVRV